MLKKLLFLFSLLAAAAVCAQDYSRVVSADHVRQMSTFERAQYQKAIQLLNNRQYRAAAVEFERFILQYQQSEMKPYMIFMRAYSLYQAKDRNKAISIFNEVLDYYPGVIDAAAPALYYRGMAAFDNGDYAAGMRSMKELVDDEDYVEHPVAANASLQLVRNYWRNKEPEKAAAYLCKIFDDFRQSAPKTAESARNYYAAYCLCTGRSKDYQAWYLRSYASEAAEKKKTKEQFRADMVSYAYDLAVNNYHWMYNHDDLMSKYRGGKKKGTDPIQEVWNMLSEFRHFYEKGNMMWDWYYRAIRINVGRSFLKPSQFEDLVSETCKFIASVPDDEKNKGRQDNRYKTVTRFLIDSRAYDQELYVNARIKDRKAAAWNELDCMERRGKFTDAVAHLDKMMSNFKDDAGLVRSAGYRKGAIQRDRLGQYDEAIKTYQNVSDPPHSLWELVTCYQRKKDSQAALKQLIEIENAFPDHGPRAAWARASYQHSLGNKAQAVKEGRYIMKKYPKSGESSYAHQLLEKYGIETGGGVLDDMM